MYRNRGSASISANPSASRKELFNLEHESYLWLRANDIAWYEENSPAAKKTFIDWVARDDEYLEMIKKAIEFFKNQLAYPSLISVNLLKKNMGIPSLHKLLAMDKTPKTAAYLEKHLEPREEWRKRKIYWAVQDFKERGITPNLYEIIIKADLTKAFFIPI